jgi:hypothetical protein
VFNVASEDREGSSLFSASLQDYVKQAPTGSVRLAVVLSQVRGTLCGVVLQRVNEHTMHQTCWMNLGSWETEAVLECPGSEIVNLKVLQDQFSTQREPRFVSPARVV